MTEVLSRRGLRRGIAAFLTALCLLCAGAVLSTAAAPARAAAAVASSRGVPAGFVGMNLPAPLWPNVAPPINLAHELSRMVSAGVQSVRAPVDWSTFQPYASFAHIPASDTRGFVSVHGVPTDFSSLDTLVALAAQRRMTVMPAVLNAPSWDSVHSRGSVVHAPRANRPFADFMTALVQRYGPRGTFWATHRSVPRVPIRSWQIWNEPYNHSLWSRTPWPRTYVALVHAAHDAVKRADPHARIVLAGLASYSPTWLKQIYAVHGARKWFDVVAIHPYTAAPQGVITLVHLARTAMAAGGDGAKPITLTELGWPSSCKRMVGPPTRQTCRHWLTRQPFGWEADRTGQKQRLTTVLRLLGASYRALHVIGFDYYTWATADRPGGPSFDFAGIFQITARGLVAKPAYRAFVKGALALEGCRAKGSTATRCLH